MYTYMEIFYVRDIEVYIASYTVKINKHYSYIFTPVHYMLYMYFKCEKKHMQMQGKAITSFLATKNERTTHLTLTLRGSMALQLWFKHWPGNHRLPGLWNAQFCQLLLLLFPCISKELYFHSSSQPSKWVNLSHQ